MYLNKKDVNHVYVYNKEYFKTLKYYLIDQLPQRGKMDGWSVLESEDFIKILLDNVYKGPIYSIGLKHDINMFNQLDDKELLLAVKICLILDIGGASFVDELNERSWSRRETELLGEYTGGQEDYLSISTVVKLII